METIKFYKMTGAGNDFIFIKAEENPNFKLEEKLISQICNRRYGIGADGLMYIKKSQDCDFEIEYFNSDGKPGSLCGNGSRCSLIFANEYYEKKTSYNFKCGNSLFRGEILDKNLARFYLNNPLQIKIDFKIKAASQLINACFVDVGSPHVIININDIAINPKYPDLRYKDLKTVPVKDLGAEIRWHKDFSPNGTNVNFISIENENTISIRSFERGVEDETLACGTGSTSAAIIARLKYGLKPPIKVQTYGGDILTIGFNFNPISKEFADLYLEGPAKIVFIGEYIFD